MKPTATQAAAFGGLMVALGMCLQTCDDVQPAPAPAPVEANDTDRGDDTDTDRDGAS